MRSISGTSPEGKQFSIEEYSDQSSVEIDTNAKGEATVTVKVYDADPFNASERAVAVVIKTLASLRLHKVKVAGDTVKDV